MKHSALLLAGMLLLQNTTAHGGAVDSPATKADHPTDAPSVIVLKSESGKRPAIFPHAKHQTKHDCDTCHKNENFPTDKKWDLKTGHALCMGCHKAKNEGPTKCNNACHQ